MQEKINRLLDILNFYEIIYAVKKRRTTKGKHIHKSRYYFSKRRIIIVLDAKYLNSLIDEAKISRQIEAIQVILTKTNGKYFTTADKNSAYNQSH